MSGIHDLQQSGPDPIPGKDPNQGLTPQDAIAPDTSGMVGDIEAKHVGLWTSVLVGFLGISWSGWCYVVQDRKDAPKWQFGPYEKGGDWYLRVWNGSYWWHATPNLTGDEYALGGFARQWAQPLVTVEGKSGYVPKNRQEQPHEKEGEEKRWLYCKGGGQFKAPLALWP
ncbi:hypothetical protein AB0B79_26380 [Streptomyces sp. NPDC039022]|uniref:hypothetical protein n=1 Tax=Streptomyces sp. NPDC039022 TaxID=3157091 RepID=UPI0033FB64DE